MQRSIIYSGLVIILSLSLLIRCANIDSKGDLDLLLKLSNTDTIPFSDRERYCKIALNCINPTLEDSIKKKYLFSIARSYERMRNWNKAGEVYSNLRVLAKDNPKDLAKAFYGSGKSFENKSINDSAFYCYDKAHKLYKKNKQELEECIVLQEKAKIQYFSNDYLGADQNLILALKIAQRLSDYREMFFIYAALGIDSNEQQDFKEAEKYYKKAEAIIENVDSGRDSLTAQVQFIFGNNELRQNKIKSAVRYYERALEAKVQSKKVDVLYLQILDNLGYCHMFNNRSGNAKSIFNSTSKMRDSLRIEQGKNFNRLYLSKYYLIKKDSAKSISFGKEALQISKEFRAPNDILICLKHLAVIDKRNALGYSEEYIKISDSIQKTERETRNKFAKIEYETEELIREIERATQEKSIFLFSGITLSSLCLMLGVIYSLKSRHQEMVYVHREQREKEEIFKLIQEGESKLEVGRQIEKKRIARDLHDGIMNKLASTRFNLYSLNNSRDDETIDKCIHYIDNLQDIEQEIRRIAHDLNADVFAEKEIFTNALTGILDQSTAGSRVTLNADIDATIDWRMVGNDIKINVYRILQEALQNIKKYARASEISVFLGIRKEALVLEIIDNGVGFDISEIQEGLGLANIRMRAQESFGDATIISNKSEGTQIKVVFPTFKIS